MNPVFAPGEVVSVREDYPPGHVRTPVYVRGRHGVIHRVLGEFKNPEILATGGDGFPKKTLYQVRFEQHELWPNYIGAKTDALFIDLYEHWLRKC